MSEWHNYQIYYTDTDQLILDCIYPVLAKYDDQLETSFWERHYAGGPHVRVRLRGATEAVARVGDELITEARRYMFSYPSKPLNNYSSGVAQRLMEMEGEAAEPDDLVYRVNEIRERPYQRLSHHLASDDAVDLLEQFLHDCMPLAVAILTANQPKHDQMLRLYFLEALFVSGDLPRGSVSFKSHWEGFATSLATGELSTRVRRNYEEQRETIKKIMLDVKTHYDNHTLDSDPVLKYWYAILQNTGKSAETTLKAGKHLTFQMTSTDEVRLAWQSLTMQKADENPFLRTLYDDERFMACIQYEPRMLVPRVLTNLLYSLVAVVGLKAIDKMALCYYAHKAVEDHFGCDLIQILQETIKSVVDEHGHRLAQPS